MRQRQRGLTLVELMVTLAAAIILLAVGLPLFSGVVGSNEATARANAMLSALRLSRSEALKRGSPSYLCAATSTLPAATPDCATASPDWTNGWIAHTDDDLSDGFDAASTLRMWDGLRSTATIAFVASPTGSTQVAFGPQGATVNDVSFTFELDESSATGGADGVAERCLTVTPSGQVRIVKGACP